MAHLHITEPKDASGALAEAYAVMSARPMPEVYRPAHGGLAGIIRAHSLDPELMLEGVRVLGRREPGGSAGVAAPRAGGGRHVTLESVLLLNGRSRRVSACRRR